MKATLTPTRPLVRYHGGKWKLAPWIISHFPGHKVYVEPYGGGGSILIRKPRAYAEIYNDLDGEMVNLFRTARDRGNELISVLELTPFSRTDFLEAWEPSADSLEMARRTVIRSFMGFGSAAVTKMRAVNQTERGGLAHTGFRSNSNRSGTTPAHDWKRYPSCLVDVIERLRGVVIENRDAAEVMLAHDGKNTLHYVDPPYMAETRDAGGDYRHEMTYGQHCELGKLINSLEGSVVVSGYPCELYECMFSDWKRYENKGAHADGAGQRTEVIWTRNIQDELFQ